jgi:hypothetical protein
VTLTYPATIGAAQLNATANVSGAFAYTPPAGTLLDAGVHTISATFTPSNTDDYVSASATRLIQVLKGTVTITWPNPGPITYGAMLTGLQLNASTSAGGSFTYSPPYGTILNAGTHTLTATFTPNSPPNYHPATATRTIVVNKAPSVVNWAGDLAPIVYGTPLGSAQLYATSSTAGTITYNPPAGTLLDAGLRTITMTFTPDDPANYHPVTQQKQIAVDKQTTTVTWNSPAPIVYGTPLSATQLNATGSQPGSFEYETPAGTVLNAGTHTLWVYFTPESPNYYGGRWSTTLVVEKRMPAITWDNPASIVYGTALSSAQLNASADVPGAFTYAPAAGAVLGAGTHVLSVTFEPSDPANHNAASAGATIVVEPATPVITWPDQGQITYGTPLSASQLNATASVPGTFAYTPDFGAVLPAGNQTLSVTFTPESANYASVTDTALLAVARQTAQVTWPTPAAITYGTPLSGTQLNATANVPGTFVYAPPAGTVVGAGTTTIHVNFTPDDTDNYQSPGAVGVTLQVNPATPVIAWPAPAAITYGTALSGAQLNASANMPGTFAYSPAAGAVPGAGAQTLTVTFTPADSANNNSASASVTLHVNKATPQITWPAPSAIAYGAALSATQLNATANVPGSFAYSPAAGSVPGAGTHALSVTFTPADAANYDSATAGHSIVVNKVALTIRTNDASKVYGQALPAFTVSGTGFVNGDTVASLSGTASFSTPATATSAPGSYSVTPGGLTSGNYTITFTAGTLTVTKASTSVALTTNPNPSHHNQNVQLRAVVSAAAPGAGTPTGTVQFRRGSTLLGTATLVNGVATLTKRFNRGTHSLTATYVGNTNFNGSVGSATHQVN